MRWGLAGVLIAIAVVAVAGYAIGAGKSSKDLVLCASKNSGDLSLASAKGKCAKGEKKLTVAKEGPVGPVGPQGAPGAPGADANATLEAVHYVTGSGSVNCATEPGTFCLGFYTGIRWENFGVPGYEKAGFYKEANGTVHLVGGVAFTNGGGQSTGFDAPGAFVLPPGFRPALTRVFKVPGGAEGTSLSGSVTVEVKASGAVAMGYSSAGLDGISFRTP